MISQIIREDIGSIVSDFENDLKKLEGKTIFITGGNGCIASYLVDVFSKFNEKLERPCKLIILNRNPIKEKSRLAHLIGNENVEFIAQDVGKNFQIPLGVDIIIHAASRANPASFLQDPIDTIDANVTATRNLLEYAKENPVENFIFFSSGEIYGNPVKEFVPTPETYTGNIDCLHPMSCYIESKRFSETMCSVFFRKYNVPVKMLRILLAYGPGMRDDGKVISDFYVAAKNNKEITIRDRGEATRSFCYISDVTRAILKIMFNGVNGEAYNVGNDLENISIKELAFKIAEVLDNNTEVKPNLDAPIKQIYGIPTRHLDISKLRELGFEPKIGIKEGLERLKKHEEEKGWQV
jgi:nucleoside-diphosphate-sugar epimerase